MTSNIAEIRDFARKANTLREIRQRMSTNAPPDARLYAEFKLIPPHEVAIIYEIMDLYAPKKPPKLSWAEIVKNGKK